jgi:hypothetical protein
MFLLTRSNNNFPKCFDSLVVGLPANLWSFCQPSRTESENSDYVLRGKKACVRCAELSIGIESQ